MLLQAQKGKQRVIAYFSRKTNEHKNNYHSYELETLAVVEAVEYFRYYLADRHFTIYTDCSAVRYTLQPRAKPSARTMRWLMRIQEYDFEIKHRPGAQVRHVDALSRNLPKNTTAQKALVLAATASELNRRSAAQKTDGTIQEIIKSLQLGERKHANNYQVSKGVLQRRTAYTAPAG